MPDDQNRVIVGLIDGSCTLLTTGRSFCDIACCIETYNLDYGAEYIAIINGEANYLPGNKTAEFTGSLRVDSYYIDDKEPIDIDAEVELQGFQEEKNLLGFFDYLSEDGFYKDIKGQTDIHSEDFEYELESQVSIPWDFSQDLVLNGSVDVQLLEYTPYQRENEIRCSVTVNKICEHKDLYGTVDTWAFPVSEDIIKDVEFQYLEQYRCKDIDCTTNLDAKLREAYLYGCTRIMCEYYRYSLYSKIHVVPRVDKDFYCSITVDSYYTDLYGDLNVFPNYRQFDILRCACHMDEYLVRTIYGYFTLDHTYTVRDIYCSIGIVGGSNTDLPCAISVVQPNYLYNYDLPCKITNGYPSRYDIYSSILVLGCKNIVHKDFPCKVIAKNNYPALPSTRIVIAVDPLWVYDPYVLKNSLHTFFSRSYLKYNFEIVFGGSPRSDWDIVHIAHMYGVHYRDMYNVPIVYDPCHPSKSQDSIDHFIYHMFKFDQDSPVQSIGRVFLFADAIRFNNISALRKIEYLCRQKHIPCVVIHSDGNYDESDMCRCDYDKNSYDMHMDQVSKHPYHYHKHHDPHFNPDKPCLNDHKIVY